MLDTALLLYNNIIQQIIYYLLYSISYLLFITVIILMSVYLK